MSTKFLEHCKSRSKKGLFNLDYSIDFNNFFFEITLLHKCCQILYREEKRIRTRYRTTNNTYSYLYKICDVTNSSNYFAFNTHTHTYMYIYKRVRIILPSQPKKKKRGCIFKYKNKCKRYLF